ncbi:MAG: RNA polymerase sigma factor [Gammaproteobacteria bacterium]
MSSEALASDSNQQRGIEDAADKALLAAIARGERDAFDRLYRRYYPRLRDFLGRLMTNKHEAVDEVLNDTMYVVWTKAGTFRNESRLSTWVFGIAYRKALKHFAKESRNRLEQMPDDWALSLSDGNDIAANAQLRDTLLKAVEKLSPIQRSVVELTYEYGYSYAEIAQILGCPENTVKTRMFHARDKLRKILETLARWEK